MDNLQQAFDQNQLIFFTLGEGYGLQLKRDGCSVLSIFPNGWSLRSKAQIHTTTSNTSAKYRCNIEMFKEEKLREINSQNLYNQNSIMSSFTDTTDKMSYIGDVNWYRIFLI